MKPDSEFNRPLKARDAAKGSNFWRSIGWGVLVFLILGLPLFHFYDGFAKVGQLLTPEKPAPQIVVVEKEVAQTAQKEPDSANQVSGSKEPSEPDAGDSSRVEREGRVIRIKPRQVEPEQTPVRRQEQAQAHLPDPQLVERGATGVIPKKSADGLRAMDVYSRQPDTEGNFGVARVVIVIGGLGISQTSTQRAIESLPPGVTLAFAPYGNSLTRWMQQARKAGHELLLQVPMEPIGYPNNNPGRHTLRSDVDLQENLANLHWAMSRITNYVGITNYLGGRLMSEPAALSPIFSEIADRGLLFFDDGSVKNSVAKGVSLKALLPYARGEIMLDNVRSRSSIGEKLDALAAQAKRTGLAIGVGNAFPDTIAMVSEFSRRARENGIEITPLSAVVKDPSR
jgi:hypothetical protein